MKLLNWGYLGQHTHMFNILCLQLALQQGGKNLTLDLEEDFRSWKKIDTAIYWLLIRSSIQKPHTTSQIWFTDGGFSCRMYLKKNSVPMLWSQIETGNEYLIYGCFNCHLTCCHFNLFLTVDLLKTARIILTAVSPFWSISNLVDITVFGQKNSKSP